jgi:carbon-monoxide dehydrogenase medium subunit
MARYDYHRPVTLQQASELRASKEGARFIAGGTDVMARIHHGTLRPTALISLRSIPGLAGIEIGERTRIGATTLVADIVSHPELRERFPALCQAAGRLGSEQIRNAATIGGNLCNASPCADSAPSLLVYDAIVRIWGPTGTRDVALADFFVGPGQTSLGPDELLHSILIDTPDDGTRATFLKKGRVAMDLATASVAAMMLMEGRTCKKARFAAGSVAPLPMRLDKVEALLAGAVVTPALAAQARSLAEQAVKPITDLRSTAHYRRHIVGVYVQRAIEVLGQQS